MMSEINYLHNEGCQNKRLNMNCHSQKKAKGMTFAAHPFFGHNFCD